MSDTLFMTKAERAILNKLSKIEKYIGVKERMFEGLLVSDIVKDLRVNADYVVNEWILAGKLRAVKLPGQNRSKGGYRISLNDYLNFLESIQFTPEEEKIVFVRRPEDIVKDFKRKREMGHGNN